MMTADEHKAKINAAGGIIGDLVRKFLNKKRVSPKTCGVSA